MSPVAQRAIVVIDDNEEDIFIFKRLLAKTGTGDPILPFLDGEEAIKFLGRVANGGLDLPLVCFLDIKMPKYTGFDVLDAIRASDVLDAVPAVMLSSSDDRRDIVKSTTKGAQGYLVKHPSAQTLRCVVDEARIFRPTRKGPQTAFAEIKANLLRR